MQPTPSMNLSQRLMDAGVIAEGRYGNVDFTIRCLRYWWRDHQT